VEKPQGLRSGETGAAVRPPRSDRRPRAQSRSTACSMVAIARAGRAPGRSSFRCVPGLAAAIARAVATRSPFPKSSAADGRLARTERDRRSARTRAAPIPFAAVKPPVVPTRRCGRLAFGGAIHHAHRECGLRRRPREHARAWRARQRRSRPPPDGLQGRKGAGRTGRNVRRRFRSPPSGRRSRVKMGISDRTRGPARSVLFCCCDAALVAALAARGFFKSSISTLTELLAACSRRWWP
jgi:hypothetical protein